METCFLFGDYLFIQEKEFGLGEDNEKFKIETRRLSEETSLKDRQLEDLRNDGDAYRHEVRLLVSYLLLSA